MSTPPIVARKKILRLILPILVFGSILIISIAGASDPNHGNLGSEIIPVEFEFKLYLDYKDGSLTLGATSADLEIHDPNLNSPRLEKFSSEESLDADLVLHDREKAHRIPVELLRTKWQEKDNRLFFTTSTETGIDLQLTLRNSEDLLKLLSLAELPWFRRERRRRELIQLLKGCSEPSDVCSISDSQGFPPRPWQQGDGFRMSFELLRKWSHSESLFFPKTSAMTRKGSEAQIQIPRSDTRFSVRLKFR